MSPLFNGIVCAYHPATLGSNPMHTINAFSFPGKFVLYLSLYCQKNENKQNRPGLAHIFKIVMKYFILNFIFKLVKGRPFNFFTSNICQKLSSTIFFTEYWICFKRIGYLKRLRMKFTNAIPKYVGWNTCRSCFLAASSIASKLYMIAHYTILYMIPHTTSYRNSYRTDYLIIFNLIRFLPAGMSWKAHGVSIVPMTFVAQQ